MGSIEFSVHMSVHMTLNGRVVARVARFLYVTDLLRKH